MIVAGLLLLLALGAGLLLYLRRESARQELLVKRMSTSKAYRGVQQMLRMCPSQRVERVELRPEAVTVTLYPQPNEQQVYDFEAHDMDALEPVQLAALAQLVTADLPMLGDNRKYCFRQHRERVGDAMVRWYAYMIQPAYKDQVLRAAYDWRDA